MTHRCFRFTWIPLQLLSMRIVDTANFGRLATGDWLQKTKQKLAWAFNSQAIPAFEAHFGAGFDLICTSNFIGSHSSWATLDKAPLDKAPEPKPLVTSSPAGKVTAHSPAAWHCPFSGNVIPSADYIRFPSKFSMRLPVLTPVRFPMRSAYLAKRWLQPRISNHILIFGFLSHLSLAFVSRISKRLESKNLSTFYQRLSLFFEF